MRTWLMLTILLTTTLTQAAVYRWVDENGQVHYGDRPPAGAERMRTPPAPAASPKKLPQTDASPASNAGDNAETPFSKGKTEATDQERCDEFKARVLRYQAAGDMFIDNEDGTRHKMVAEERDSLIQRTQAQADQACAKAAGR